ncbi:FAD-dependent thymidylate synthase [Oscillatoria sp. CS-180]|uniref:FAD-dependent thymidylate synthase n=1 Tax=Oscillatoria sp. CS-180 TaxID=3021720 RepID=UPI00232CEBB1|nr:FAD-dependent thymidylate synthase [Oscillatoria sp. CS-180]MDB9528695.1 FAD-dependent thymidylate synthase [Oscillatoria sp. CS-180]
MDRFTVEVISQTPNPQQTIYAAMHQDYAEGFVAHERDQWPSEEKAGEVVIKSLLKGGRGHYGPLEHPQIVLNVGWFPHSTMQQIRTHRVGVSFDVQCLSGDTEITFVQASGSLKKIQIAELYDLWANGEKAVRERKIRGRNGEPPGLYRRDCKKRLRTMRLRVLNEETGYFETSHIQDVMCSGIQPVYRLTFEDGRSLNCTTNHHLLTPKGWQTMAEAIGLQTAPNGEVLTIARDRSVMANGVFAENEGVYRDQTWLTRQIKLGLSAQEIADLANCSDTTVRDWANRFGLKLNSRNTRFKKGQKPWNHNPHALYRDKAWLEEQLQQGLHVDEMAKAAGCSVEAIKKWVYAYGLSLNKRPTPFQKGFTPWNKGKPGYQLNLSPSDIAKRRENSARYTKRGAESNFWKGGTSDERELIGAWTRQIAPQVHEKFDYICQCCGIRGHELHAHHLVPVFADESLAYEFENLVSLCKDCHEQIHHKNLEAEFADNFEPITQPTHWHSKPKPKGRKLMAHPLKVIRVDYLGLQMTYDLEVKDPWHNFVANGLVVHNSFRYTGSRILDVIDGKRDIEEVFYLRPVGAYADRQGKKYDYTAEERQQDLEWCLQACHRYKAKIDAGFAEEHARGLIPFDVRQHWVMSANPRSLMHLLDLRWKADAQLEAQKMCEAIWPCFQAWVPAIAAWYEDNRLKKARLAP